MRARALARLTLALALVVPALASAESGEREAARSERPRVEVLPLNTTKEGPPQSVLLFPVRLRNLGAEDVKVTFTVEHASNGFVLPAPQPLTLKGARDGERGESTLTLGVQTPYRNGRVDEEGTVVVRWAAARVGDAGAEVEGSFALYPRAKGTYVPAPGLVAAGLTVVFLAMLFRPRGPKGDR